MFDPQIKEKLKEYLNDKEIAVLEKVYKRVEFEDYFFKTKSDLKWFYPLQILGYFDAQNAPEPRKTGKEGFYSIPFWSVLPYLESVSEQISNPSNEQYTNELIQIIRSVSNFKSAEGAHKDNYRTWWFFVKILLNIPNDKIPVDVIELIPMWIDSDFASDLQGHDIVRKLLPKLLTDNPEDIEKAEMIIDYVTEIKWVKPLLGKSESIFGKEEEVKTVIDTYWVWDSFARNELSMQIGEKCSLKPIYMLADRIKAILRRERNAWVEIELSDKTYRISISQVKDSEFECSLGVIDKSELEAESEGQEFLKSISARPKELLQFKVENCEEDESFISSAKSRIVELKLPEEFQLDLDSKLAELYESHFRDYSYIWYKSIGHSIHVSSRPQNTLVGILRDIILAKAKVDNSAIVHVIDDFFGASYQYPLYQRIAIHVFGKFWGEFKEKFWRVIDAENGGMFFDDPNFEAEIYSLFEQNVAKFSQQEKGRIEQLIENGPYLYLPEENIEYYKAYWKQSWYSALKSDIYFAELYQKYRDKTQTDEEVGFKEPTVRVGPGSSPKTVAEIVGMSNTELVEFLLTFRTEDHWRGPTVGGLAETVRNAARENPDRFTNDLLPFINAPFVYTHNILWGLEDAWKEKKPIDWGKIFDFIWIIVKDERFWRDELKLEDDRLGVDHRWFIGMVSQLVQEGTQKDDWAFKVELIPTCKELLLFILSNLAPETDIEDRDYVSHLLNSAFGELIIALLNLALMIARAEHRDDGKRWSDNIEEVYDQLLSEKVVDAYTLFGRNMWNFYYLDASWVERKINESKSLPSNQVWEAFMVGYLSGGNVRNALYALMKEHYLRAISYSFNNDYIRESLTDHLTVGYLRGLDDLSPDSNFGKMISNQAVIDIENVISFLWMQREYLVEGENLRQKVVEFWRWLHLTYKDKNSLNADDQKVLSAVARLTVFLHELNDEYSTWLMFSAQFIGKDFTSPFLLEYLDALKDKGEDKVKTSRHIGAIFLKILEGFTPDYDREHIKSIVKHLYELGDDQVRKDANKICDVYLHRGHDFLREICEQYMR